MPIFKKTVIIGFLLVISAKSPLLLAQSVKDDNVLGRIDKQVLALMSEGDIPGLSVVMIQQGKQVIKSYGFANVRSEEPVRSNTLFQIGSCSKAFTALAFMKLVDDGQVALSEYVSDYIPWFRAKFKDRFVKIKLLHLLHHTSGIPWQSIAEIPESTDEAALEKTIRNISGIELRRLPGERYEYATVNYDILALVISKITGKSFEEYVQLNVINELRLSDTRIGVPVDSTLMATGYKIGFFRPRQYSAPVYKGNNAAGYVISNAKDIGQWLQFQMGLATSKLYRLAQKNHLRDETVPPHDLDAYGMGWEVSLRGDKQIFHGGMNPNFSAFIAFRDNEKIGVAVLANSNSEMTKVIGGRVMKLMAGDKITTEADLGDNSDRVFSIISIIVCIYCVGLLFFLSMIISGIIFGKRKYHHFSISKLRKLISPLLLLLPFLFGIYILPKAVAGFSWNSITVWTPVSFFTALILVMAAVALSYITFLVTIFYPDTNTFRRVAPGILLMSILAGLANMLIIILLTSSQGTDMELRYLIFYFVLSLLLYLLSRSVFQKNLVRFTRGLIYELRNKLIDKIFSTSFQKFENMDRGRVYTALNDDVDTIGESANMFVMLVTSFVTAFGACLYLASIAAWATLITFVFVVFLAVLYYFVSKSANIYYENARDSQTQFMRLVNGMIDGFKEISLHRNKRLAYKKDVSASSNEYRMKTSIADIQFVNTFLLGEALLVLLLGNVAFVFPKLFPDIQPGAIMSFVIVLLYMGSSINQIVSSVPAILRFKIAWKRIQNFLKEIPANLDMSKGGERTDIAVESIKAKDLFFEYKNKTEQDIFKIGPIDLEVYAGEILFIVGGNGSGKTTLAKLLTGLYEPDGGKILINNKVVPREELGEYFSAVFNPVFLFEKLYNVNIDDKKEEVDKYLTILRLADKIRIEEYRYNTIDLSGGQRKRLALLQCYLEDSPIYLFDEWAADQDPGYRNFFYRTLLLEMRKAGKIVIAITHDDNYFDVADKLLKIRDGKLELYKEEPIADAVD